MFSSCDIYTVGESGMGPAPVFILFSFCFSAANTSRCFSLYWFTLILILFDCCPPFPTPSFLFRCVAHSLSLSLTSYLGCLALLISLSFLPYAYYMRLSFVCFAFVSWFSLLNPFLATVSFAGYSHARFLLSAFFHVCFFCFVFPRPCSFPVCFGVLFLSCDHSWIRNGPVNNNAK